LACKIDNADFGVGSGCTTIKVACFKRYNGGYTILDPESEGQGAEVLALLARIQMEKADSRRRGRFGGFFALTG
jgi:hypothetical protein